MEIEFWKREEKNLVENMPAGIVSHYVRTVNEVVKHV